MGKRDITVNGEPKSVAHDLAAGSLKEIMGAEPDDWVFAKPPEGRHYQIPDDEILPHEVSDFLIVPKWQFGGVLGQTSFDREVRRRINRLAAEAAFLERNCNYGIVDYDDEEATWFSVSALPIGKDWSTPTAAILIDVPHKARDGTNYPEMPPRWFWIDADLRTADGRMPAHFFQEAPDSQAAKDGWAHFCFYLASWKPKTDMFFAQGDSLISYLKAMEVAFHQRPRVKE